MEQTERLGTTDMGPKASISIERTPGIEGSFSQRHLQTERLTSVESQEHEER
ncbi:MAG: hypothetical protein GY696_19165 [Gammaproteobacteria bacterium]|nr:hypothetical protein [Gammaproteobacteria bacterium]